MLRIQQTESKQIQIFMENGSKKNTYNFNQKYKFKIYRVLNEEKELGESDTHRRY